MEPSLVLLRAPPVWGQSVICTICFGMMYPVDADKLALVDQVW